jgi:hypothetical protein
VCLCVCVFVCLCARSFACLCVVACICSFVCVGLRVCVFMLYLFMCVFCLFLWCLFVYGCACVSVWLFVMFCCVFAFLYFFTRVCLNVRLFFVFCLCVCVCVCACLYVCRLVCLCVCVFVCLLVCVCVCMCSRFLGDGLFVIVLLLIFICVCVCMCVVCLCVSGWCSFVCLVEVGERRRSDRSVSNRKSSLREVGECCLFYVIPECVPVLCLTSVLQANRGTKLRTYLLSSTDFGIWFSNVRPYAFSDGFTSLVKCTSTCSVLWCPCISSHPWLGRVAITHGCTCL